MKVWRDIDKVIKPTRVPKELWEYEDEMKQKPKFDKKKDKVVKGGTSNENKQ